MDFAVCKGNKVTALYQVAYDLTSKKTRKRELNALLQAADNTKCERLLIITDTRKETLEINGHLIKVIPAYEWLLDSPED